MISPLFSLLLVPFLAAMFLAVNMGASGTAPSFSAAFGAGLIRRTLIPGLFGTMVFAGALFAGKKVVLTVGSGIIPAGLMSLTLTTIVLVSVGLSLLLANWLRVPQSTSQATVLAIVGPAVIFGELETRKLLLEIVPAWLILPIVAFVIVLVARKLFWKALGNRSSVDFEAVRKHPIIKAVVVGAALYVAFAIGSNNVANASGPLAAMLGNDLGVGPGDSRFLLLMITTTLIIAPCFGIGSSLMGHRVVESTGKDITEFGPFGATLVAVITASLLLTASITRGIPTSLVQMNTAAILALGVSKNGWRNTFDRPFVKKLGLVWIIAPLLALALSVGLTLLARMTNLLTPVHLIP